MTTSTQEASTPTTGFDDIDATIRGLIDLAVWREAHPEIDGHMPPLFPGCYIVSGQRNPDTAPADIVRAIADGAPIGTIRKHAAASVPDTMFIERSFGGGVQISYQAVRDEVCERIVTGTRTVQRPDPSAPLVDVEEDIVEWKCSPILGGAA